MASRILLREISIPTCVSILNFFFACFVYVSFTIRDSSSREHYTILNTNQHMRIEHYFIKHKHTLLLFSLILIGGFLRFYNLNWGAPFYFHPDERNIASSVSQLQFPSTMNPHFFAYGSLPIYAIFFSALPLALTTCHDSFSLCRVRFEDAILFGRAYSAFFSLLLIPLMFFLGKRLFSEKAGLLGAALATFTTGLIQFAHFATFELWSTFFSVILFLISIHILEKPSKKNILLVAIATGLLMAIKATNLLLLPLPFIALGIGLYKQKSSRSNARFLVKLLISYLFVLLVTGLIFLLTNPFTILDFKEFQGTMHYESGVALGTIPVFYTGEFYSTIPVAYQLFKIFPFLLNPLLTILCVVGFFYGLYALIKKRAAKKFFLLLTTSLLFLPQAFFFVKWVRYMVPTIPFLLLLCVLLLELVADSKLLRKKHIGKIVIACTVCTTILFGTSYFMTAFVKKDTRVTASLFAKEHMSQSAPILADVYDMGIVAFNEHFPRITLFNYYDLDSPSPESSPQILSSKLNDFDYIVLPSQRLFATRLMRQKNFPEGYKFYHALTTQKNKFQKLYETPCDLFCQITYLGDQVFRFEGTASAFERPPLQIYKIVHNE